jgi:putative hemolysin
MTIMARVNQLQLRLVRTGPEVAAAQRLRYRVFHEELGALASPAARRRRSDVDRFDALADHLVVVDLDHSTPNDPCVVACYRLLREGMGRERSGFYTATEFDLAGVEVPRGVMMELGRSCVDAGYRNGTAMQLLWRGIADYIDAHGVGLMLGCASLPGIDPGAAASALAYLHHRHLAPLSLRPRALPERHVPMDRLPVEAIDAKAVARSLPPLLKAYLRMGGMVGEGAVVDRAFNTIDVCVVLPADRIVGHYQRHCRQHRQSLAAAA